MLLLLLLLLRLGRKAVGVDQRVAATDAQLGTESTTPAACICPVERAIASRTAPSNSSH